MSNAALANVLDRVKSNPSVLDEGSSRWSVKRRRASDVRVVTVFGPLLPTMPLVLESGMTMDACFAHPVALLENLAQVSTWFSQLLNDTMGKFPGEWRMVWYADEITPGNQLRPLNHRKTCLNLNR